MEHADHLRSLVAYNRWANSRVLDAAAALTDEQLDGNAGAGYETIRETLGHLLWAQVMWLARWRQEPAVPHRDYTRAELWAEFERADADLETYAASLADDDWGRVCDYHDTSGVAHSRTLGQLVTHVINHGTYHRGEAGLMITALGHSPGDLDYVYFIPEGV